jgi:hypothetical protein
MSADRSDVYGPMASCSNCKKTKKDCTFEWLRSQRFLQASQPQIGTAPPAKRRRTRSISSGDMQRNTETSQTAAVAATGTHLEANGNGPSRGADIVEFGMTFEDFPSGGSMFATNPAMAVLEASPAFSNVDTGRELEHFGSIYEEDWTPFDYDSGKGSSLATLSEVSDRKLVSHSPILDAISSCDSATALIRPDGVIACKNRKLRHRSLFTSNRNGAPLYPVVSFARQLVSSNHNARLTDSLLRIYHDSFENALACWVTKRICRYNAKSDRLLATNARPEWNRIYHRVVRLDRLASAIRGREFTEKEKELASRVLNLAVFAFASQWAQSSRRSQTKYPFHSVPSKGESGVFNAGD